jgi:hypothetical protein
MKKCLIGLSLCFFLAGPLKAQDYSRTEVYGGFLFMHDGYKNDEGNESNYLGFIGAFELNLKNWLGIVGEFGYGERLGNEILLWPESSPSIDRSNTSILVGPRFGYRKDRFRFFGHLLVGYNRKSVTFIDDDFSASDGDPAMALGLGLDISINDRISIRPVQFGILTEPNRYRIRYSGGIVIK